MSQIMIELHQAVQFIKPLRGALMETSKKKRKSVFNGLVTALKALNLVDRKEDVKGLFEGIDHNGDHWFMAEVVTSHRPEVGVQLDNAYLNGVALGRVRYFREHVASQFEDFFRAQEVIDAVIRTLECPPTDQTAGSKS